MSYDLNIWSCRKVEFEQKEINIGEYTLTIENSVTVENEDIPIDVMLSLAEIKYLTKIYLQPYTTDKIITDKAIKYAKKLAKEFDGVVENPQLDNEVFLARKRFTRATKDADYVSISWYIDCNKSLNVYLADFINLLEKYLPQALPRRYGGYEPPEFKYSEMGKEHLINFLNEEHNPVIYCMKPITYIYISDAYIDNQKFEIKDYRCNKIEIEMLKEVYLESNWQFAVKRLFRESAKLLKPFYAEIIDEKESMICSWWWKGIPAKRGNSIIIGEPYSSLIRELPSENEIELGLYYFENDINKIKIPRNLISNKKIFVINNKNVYFHADDYKYAKRFPFKKG